MARKFRLALAITGVLSVACAATPALAAEPAPPAVRFVIPAGSLDHALQSLATQGRVQLMYAPALVEQRRWQLCRGWQLFHRRGASGERQCNLQSARRGVHGYVSG